MSIRISGVTSVKTLSGLATRPTPSKVRAAVFNIWQWKVRRSHWLDLCSGSGAMSAEALVKGASFVTAVEASRAACKIIQQNLEKICKPDQGFEIHCGDVVKVLAKLRASNYDLIYFDPPYQSQLYQPVLQAIAPLMSQDAVIAVEHARERSLEEISYELFNLKLIDQRMYGQTSVSFFNKF
ncbi:RNA methyltransferase, RsmD family [Synechococcus sp. PCC 7502]|uniref:16S rRNA (guanine(966)-N(2))-methyltransferase RsmD n=1 Tax=Synechococcus sp. PCC 7502 TaxID=1173263 RepID=UPI00029FD0E1|nr:16S rRNA (guanine(966)-N(2))-methyltransferase RsmD [Synechococcus sp. PCC 7502]AFY74864.1 RNA methyltransferase, RsmD family [Synechococcus sp. PCC 7502]